MPKLVKLRKQQTKKNSVVPSKRGECTKLPIDRKSGNLLKNVKPSAKRVKKRRLQPNKPKRAKNASRRRRLWKQFLTRDSASLPAISALALVLASLAWNLVVLAPALNADLLVRGNANRKLNRPAANLAIFYVILWIYTGVQQYFYGFATVWAVDGPGNAIH